MAIGHHTFYCRDRGHLFIVLRVSFFVKIFVNKFFYFSLYLFYFLSNLMFYIILFLYSYLLTDCCLIMQRIKLHNVLKN